MFSKSREHTSRISESPRAQLPPATERASQDRVKEHKRSFLSPSISIKGDITGNEDLVVDGEVEGTINLPENEVLVGPKGRAKANVTAMKVSVEGRVNGDIHGTDRVVVKQSGRIEGDVKAPRVILEDGCQFNGSIQMNIDKEPESPSQEKQPQGSSQSTYPSRKEAQRSSAAGTGSAGSS